MEDQGVGKTGSEPLWTYVIPLIIVILILIVISCPGEDYDYD
jgi:hypothetical protein